MSVQQCINKNQTLNGEVIKCILRNQYKLAECEFKAFVIKVRNQRRKMMQNKHQYRRIILLMDSTNQQLMDKNLNAILAHFNIEKTHWIQTVQLWSSDTEENKQEWQNLLIELDNQLLDSLRDKSKASLSYKKLEDIYKFKIHTLNHLGESGLDLESSSMTSDDEPDLNAKYLLIDKYIQDLVFAKFNVEQEDLLYAEDKLSQMDKDKIYNIEDEYTEMIRHMIFGDENSEVEENVEGQDEREESESGESIKVEGEGKVKGKQGKKSWGQGEQKESTQQGQQDGDWEDVEHEEDEGQYF